MSLPEELLETARYLTRRNQSRPSQADLRRAVSTAYYALFHLLIRAATEAVVGDRGLRALVPRAFDHGEMRAVCKAFASGSVPPPVQPLVPALPADLKAVAQAFPELQDARHQADYDPVAAVNRTTAVDRVRQAVDAFAAWERVKGEPVATVFLVPLLIGKRWNR